MTFQEMFHRSMSMKKARIKAAMMMTVVIQRGKLELVILLGSKFLMFLRREKKLRQWKKEHNFSPGENQCLLEMKHKINLRINY